MSTLVPPRRKEGKREPYLSYARNLFLQLPHARRYVNAPSAPTTAPERPGAPGAWHSSVPRDREIRGGQGASGPAEAGEGKGNCKAVAQHKMRQQSKGQTARNRLAKERERKNAQSQASPALTIEGEAKGKKTQSVTAPGGNAKPTSSIGRCCGLGRSTAELAPWAASPGWASRPGGGRPPDPKGDS